MTILILAGGAGTRLWPLSRKNSPKQFQKIAGDKSTLQLAIDRIRPFGLSDVYIATNESYQDIIRQQVPEIAENHLMTEPCKRDLAAAVGLALSRLYHRGVRGPVVILWSDHLMQHEEAFREALTKAEQLVKETPERLVFLAESPRFANQNLGWIHVGDRMNTEDVHAFLGWKYKPTREVCADMFASGEWFWNPGYFVFDIERMRELYQMHQKELFDALERMSQDSELLSREYASVKSMHFDQAIIEKVDPSEAVVLKVNLGWSDPGTLYALKEAFAAGAEVNYEQGDVIRVRTRDSFLYTEDPQKILCTLGLEGMMIVNTKDVLFVCHKDEVPNLKEVLEELERKGRGELL